MTKRIFPARRAALAAAMMAAAWGLLAPPGATAAEMTVFKSPTCGCCKDWVKHMEANGFDVTVKERADLSPVKDHFKVPYELSSCHTAVVDGYVIEGHVPAADVKRLLTEKPKARGLATPGMPVGSPGMEMGGRKDPYDVLLFGDGEPKVYSRYE